MPTVYISLGSNVGDRRKNIEIALAEMASEQIEITKRSSLYETAPRDYLDQPWFLNMVAQCRTEGSPFELLSRLLAIEKKLGRIRGETSITGGPRIIDLDILLFGVEVVETAELTIPHPRILERRFILEPFLEIASEVRHPVTMEPISKSLPAVQDQQVLKLALSSGAD